MQSEVSKNIMSVCKCRLHHALHVLEGKGGSRILKWGVNFCNVREIKYYFNIRGIRKNQRLPEQLMDE